MQTITKFIWKNKYLLIILCLLGLLLFQWKQYKSTKTENERFERNIENMNFKFEEIKGKNGELHQAVQTLTLKKDELEFYNNNLSNLVDSMKIKTKDLESVVKMNYRYKNSIKNKLTSSENKELKKLLDSLNSLNKNNNLYQKEIDSIKTILSGDKRYNVDYDNDNIRVVTTIVVPNNKEPYLDGLDYHYDDSLTIVGETQYKRRWIFWRRPIGVKLHIKSNNPSFHLDRVESYKFEK